MSGDLPPVVLVRANDTHRLIPSKYSDGGASVLTRLTANDDDLSVLFELDGATNDRLLAQADLLPGIGIHELLFDVPYASIVNAAFCHAHPLGSRFNWPDRGAWYAALAIRTAQAEIAFHKAIEYAEIGQFDDSVTYDDYQVDISAEMHDIRDVPIWKAVLSADSYVESQLLAERLLAAGSLALAYSSVRDRRGACVAVFRPAVVTNVRRGGTWRFTWSGKPTPTIRPES